MSGSGLREAYRQILGFADPGAATSGSAASTSGQDPLDEREADTYALAQSHFEGKEYSRCAHALAGCRGPRAVFLRMYARYLAGEKRRDEERIEASGALGRTVQPNR